jgi:hypothetical protein
MRAMPLPVTKYQLPIVQGEVGDTWNYGTASDPHKLAEYRALLRKRISQVAISPRRLKKTSPYSWLFSPVTAQPAKSR